MSGQSSGDAGDPSALHDSCLVLCEVIKAALDLASNLQRQVELSDVDDTTKRVLGEAVKTIGQADALLKSAEPTLGAAREDHDAAALEPPEPSGSPDQAKAALARALAKRRASLPA